MKVILSNYKEKGIYYESIIDLRGLMVSNFNINISDI